MSADDRPASYQDARQRLHRHEQDCLFWVAADDAAHAKRIRARIVALCFDGLPFCHRGLLAGQRADALKRIDAKLAGPMRPTFDNPDCPA